MFKELEICLNKNKDRIQQRKSLLTYKFLTPGSYLKYEMNSHIFWPDLVLFAKEGNEVARVGTDWRGNHMVFTQQH